MFVIDRTKLKLGLDSWRASLVNSMTESELQIMANEANRVPYIVIGVYDDDTVSTVYGSEDGSEASYVGCTVIRSDLVRSCTMVDTIEVFA